MQSFSLPRSQPRQFLLKSRSNCQGLHCPKQAESGIILHGKIKDSSVNLAFKFELAMEIDWSFSIQAYSPKPNEGYTINLSLNGQTWFSSFRLKNCMEQEIGDSVWTVHGRFSGGPCKFLEARMREEFRKNLSVKLE